MKFIKKIESFRNKQNLLNTFVLLSQCISILIIIFLLILMLPNKNNPSIFITIQALKVVTLGIIFYYGVKLKNSFLTTLNAAAVLDLRNKDKSETFLNATELYFEYKSDKKEILERIYENAENKIKNTNIDADYTVLKKKILIPAICIALFVAVFILSPIRVKQTAEYLSTFSLPQKAHNTNIIVSPGNKKILKNENLRIRVENSENDLNYKIVYKVDKIWREEAMQNSMKLFSNLDFSFDYFIKSAYANSDTFKIEVYELPVVKKINIKYIYPRYTHLSSVADTSQAGNISAIENAKILLSIEANNTLKSADIFLPLGLHKSMERTGKASFKTEFKLTKSGFYHFDLVDILNNKSEKIEYPINVVKDEYPEIEFLYPAKDTTLSKDMKTPLVIIASDDFGLKKLKLNYKVNENSTHQLMIKEFIRGNITNIDYILDLSKVDVLPGDNILYWAQISDNSPTAKTSYTQKYNLRFPSITEIYKEIEKTENEKQDKLKETYKKAQKLRKEFDVERRKILKNDKTNWQQKEKLKEVLKKQKDMAKDVEKVAKEYNNLIEKMKKNNAVSKSTFEKLKKIEELMKEISNEKLKKAMEEMQKKLENAKPEDLKKAMEELKFSMEDFNKKLEQTIKMLEDIKKEQALEKSLEIAKEMEKTQKAVNKKTKNGATDKNKLQKMQKSVDKNLDELKKQLEDTKKLLDKDKDKKLMDKLDELQKQLNKEDLKSELNKSMENLQKNMMQKAQKSQQNALSQISDMKKQLEQMLAMMSGASSAQMGQSIENALLRLIILSKDLNKIKSQYSSNPNLIIDRLISNYGGLNIALKELYKTPMIMLVIGAKFINDSGFTSSEFSKMFEDISNQRHYKVKTYLENIQKGYNFMIFDLLQSKKNMNKQGGMSSGMQSLMQSLQKMSGQQMMMNMLTMQMMKQMQGGKMMSNEVREQAQRLAEEEGRLADNLKRLIRTNDEAQKRANSLGNIANELDAISRNLKQNRIDNELIDKQKRILSRMLDAQKSIHKKGFSKKRRSELSEKIFDGNKKNNTQKFDEIKLKSLLKDSEKSYPMEYRKLIDEYLKKLNEGL